MLVVRELIDFSEKAKARPLCHRGASKTVLLE
jgi:hypothetical protein